MTWLPRMNPKPYNVTAIAPVYMSMQRHIHSPPRPPTTKWERRKGRNDTVSNGSTVNLAEFRVLFIGSWAGMGTLMDLNLGLPQPALTFEFEAARFKAT